MEKAVLRPISRNRWAGISKYKNCYTYLAPYWTRSGSIYTGLDSKDIERLGKALGQDLTIKIEDGQVKGFWQNYFLRVGDKDIFIDVSNPRGELDYLFLKSHKRVSTSIDKVLPSHDFILIDENEEAKVINEYNRNKRNALRELDKLSPIDKRKALRLYGVNPDSSSDEMVENRLTEYIEKDPKKFFDIWVDNKQRDTEFMIKQAVSLNVISRNKSIYKYGQDVIGHTLEDAIDYLDNPLHQDIKLAILSNIKNNIK